MDTSNVYDSYATAATPATPAYIDRLDAFLNDVKASEHQYAQMQTQTKRLQLALNRCVKASHSLANAKRYGGPQDIAAASAAVNARRQDLARVRDDIKASERLALL